jgi:hypothetical protein
MFNFIGRILNDLGETRARKKIAALVLEEFAKTVNSTVEDIEKAGRIKNAAFKEMLKFESLAFLLWLFQDTSFAPEPMQRVLLDEIHSQYFARLRKHGYDGKLIQTVCDEFAFRYQIYEEVYRPNRNLAGVGSRFVRFLAENSKTEPSLIDIDIPIQLTMKVKPQFDMFRKILHAPE